MNKEMPQRKSFSLIEMGILLAILTVLFSIAVPSIIQSIQHSRENANAAKAHNLVIAMFNYANDNDGTYPSGPTSTVIFQTLFDARYLQRPTDVYLPMAGKVLYPNETVKGLQSQNVSWDIVEHADGTGLNGNDPGDMPVVFPTGLGAYTFVDGSNPAKIAHPDQAAWGQDGVTIGYLNQEAAFLRPASASDAIINLTKVDFKTGARTYKTVQP